VCSGRSFAMVTAAIVRAAMRGAYGCGKNGSADQAVRPRGGSIERQGTEGRLGVLQHAYAARAASAYACLFLQSIVSSTLRA
jgi:hypothetical protein